MRRVKMVRRRGGRGEERRGKVYDLTNYKS